MVNIFREFFRLEFQWVNIKTLKISGRIDEYFQCEFLDPANSHLNKNDLFDQEIDVWVDLQHVEKINSCGAKTWFLWIENVKATIHYVNCSATMIGQLNMLGKTAIVESFEVLYGCDSCEHEESRILVVGKDVIPKSDSMEIEAPVYPCPGCGKKTLEMEAIPEEYFQFLASSHSRK